MRSRAILWLTFLLTPFAGIDGSVAGEPTAFDHLRAIVARSPAPEYRRAGSPGMVAVADYAAGRLAASGYRVVRQDFGFTRYAIDYAAGREPALVRADGYPFKTESAFNLQETTPAQGITCVVRAVADVGPGECGFIPFRSASPEWKNAPFVSVGDDLDAIVAAGGAGAIVQGDVQRHLVFAQSARRALPTVVAAAEEEMVVDRTVRLRAVGGFVSAVGRNVVGVRRSPQGTTGYVVLLAHADGWFQAAADNGSGAAAVLRAAELLAGQQPEIGVVAALMDAEEVGLIGAEQFVRALQSSAGLVVGDGGPPLRLDDVEAVINLDASSARASDAQDFVRGTPLREDAPVFQWRAMVASEEPLLASAFLSRFAAHGVLGLPIPSSVFAPVGAGAIDGTLRSDVQPFAAAGVPFVWPVSGYPEYHTDGDTLATVDPADVEALALAAVDLAGDIALLPLGRVVEPLRPPFGDGVPAAGIPEELLHALHDHLVHEH